MNSQTTVQDPLPAIDEMPAAHLTGRKLKNGWSVGGFIPRNPSATGGQFSVSYFVENDQGHRAFLKALNVGAALGAGEGNIIDRLKAFTDACVYERDLHKDCDNYRMSRVIRLVDAGEVDVPEAGVLREVPYLIFELAEGDIRAHQASLDAFDLAWVLRTLKHATLGIEQLHSALAAHQDLKPSNILTQEHGKEMKIGDLGRAERRGVPGPYADRTVPGAIGYAPPEQLYGAFKGSWEERRAADVYHLGSLAIHLFLGHNFTSLLQFQLPPELGWRKWQGTFAEALPYLRTAHAEVIAEFETVVRARSASERLTVELVGAVRELTDPDPALRGHPLDRAAKTSSYSVRRYVSLFNRLAAGVEAGMVHSK